MKEPPKAYHNFFDAISKLRYNKPLTMKDIIEKDKMLEKVPMKTKDLPKN